MKRSGIFVSTVFGGLCFVAFGLWGAFQCAVSWIGHASWICGGFFILFAPMGFVAGLADFWLVRMFMRLLFRKPGNSGNQPFD